MNVLKRFFKDTIIYGIAAVLPRAINIFLVRLHTDTLSADKFAVNTMYYVYAAYFNALLTYGMETAFFRFFSKEKEKGKIVSTSFISLFVTTVMFAVFFMIYSNDVALFFGFSNILFFQILIITLTLDTLVVIPFAYLRVINKPIQFTLYKVVNILIFATLNIFFLWFVPYAIEKGIYLPESLIKYVNYEPKVIHIFVSGLVASLVTFILLLPVFFKFKISFDIKLLKKMLYYSLPIMVGSLAFVTNENIDKLFLKNIVGEQQMGVYAACYKLGVFMTLYIMAFKMGAEPFFFNQANKENAKENYSVILSWFTFFGGLFMLIVISFIDFFAKILLKSDEYFDALEIVPIILLANLFLGIYNNLSIWYKLTDRTKYGMYFSIFGAGITIIFNLIMIPKIGFMASAWATLIAYGSMMIISYFFGKKHYPVPYNLKKVASYLLITILLSYLSFTYFRGDYIISFIFIFIFFGWIYYLEKQMIKKFLKR
ncbi:MATE family efflux transporter [Tenacibaculum sp.]|nr:MATE family efflux transporter [Tenacibaculum sp.]